MKIVISKRQTFCKDLNVKVMKVQDFDINFPFVGSLFSSPPESSHQPIEVLNKTFRQLETVQSIVGIARTTDFKSTSLSAREKNLPAHPLILFQTLSLM